MMKHILYIFLLPALFTSCTEPYIPELKDNGTRKTLIVEGYINAEGNSEYTLGYIAPLYQEADSSYTRVTGAQLSIEEENGQVFNEFSYAGNSRYVIHHPSLKLNSKYRLRIKAENKEYLSAYVPVLVSPEIENLKWKQNIEEGVSFYVDTHGDDQLYYRWDFEETWRFRTPQQSLFIFDGARVRDRASEEYYPTTCYRTEKSSEIILSTTEAQSENTVKDFKVLFIPNFSEKLDLRYSLLVKQYALSKEAFGYWSLVKKNSEDIGDIFGTMPTELVGNISCISHPDQKVVGMIEAGKIGRKRIFVNYNDFLTPWIQTYEQYPNCLSPPIIAVREANAFFTSNPYNIPISEYYENGSLSATHYTYSEIQCIDCSLRGSKEPPVFWIN